MPCSWVIRRKRIKRIKEFILISVKVMTSHRKTMMIKSCWELADIALVIVAINRKVIRKERFSHIDILSLTSFMIGSTH